MDEALSYKWASQAIRHVEGLIAPHVGQRLADSVAAAILEAYKLHAAEQGAQADQNHCPAP